ncbi:MAG: DUF2029 domain-containing protein [Candidatus Obscuribacterales bacterium]|nr:DUF2029 domain-containing protein [Candidatus Obscuribacterales bacterium]
MHQSNAKDDTGGEKSRPNRSGRNLIFAILSLCVCITIPAMALLGSQSSFGQVSDFPEYYGAMKLLCSGRAADMYKFPQLFAQQQQDFPELGQRGIGFYIPPFSAPLLAPIGLAPAKQSYILYMLFSIGSLITSTVILSKHFALKAEGCIWLLTALCLSAPIFESMKIAQLAPFLLLSFSVFLHFACTKELKVDIDDSNSPAEAKPKSSNDIIAGLSLAIMLLKPQELLPIAVYLAGAMRIKVIIALLAVFGLLMLISVGSGTQVWQSYFELLKDSAGNTQFMQPELSATLRGQLLRLPGFDHAQANTISSIAMAVCQCFIAFTGFKHRKAANFERGLLQVALPLGLLSSLHCHDYDLLLLTPWVLSLLSKDTNKEKGATSRSKIGIASQLAILSFVLALVVYIYVPIHYDALIKNHQIINPYFILFGLASLLSAIQFTVSCKNETHASSTAK